MLLVLFPKVAQPLTGLHGVPKTTFRFDDLVEGLTEVQRAVIFTVTIDQEKASGGRLPGESH